MKKIITIIILIFSFGISEGQDYTFEKTKNCLLEVTVHLDIQLHTPNTYIIETFDLTLLNLNDFDSDGNGIGLNFSDGYKHLDIISNENSIKKQQTEMKEIKELIKQLQKECK